MNKAVTKQMRQSLDYTLSDRVFSDCGKSVGGRVAYVDFTVHETIYLITAYPKSEKDNLTDKERNEIVKVIAVLEKGLQKQEIRK